MAGASVICVTQQGHELRKCTLPPDSGPTLSAARSGPPSLGRPQRRGRYRTGHLLRLFGPGRAGAADLRDRPVRPLRPPPPHRRTTPRAHTTTPRGLRRPDPAGEPRHTGTPQSPTVRHRNVNSPRPALGSPSSRRARRAIGPCQPIRTTRWPSTPNPATTTPTDQAGGPSLRPEHLPTDGAPDQPPWPWTESDLPTTDQPSTRPTPGQEMLQALQAQSRANQAPAWTRPPRRWALPLRPRPLVIAGCLALAAAGGAVAVPFAISASRSVPPPSAGVHPPAPINPATPAAAAVTPTPTIIPTPVDGAPTPAAIPPPPPGPNPPAGDATATPAAVVPAPPATDHQVTRRSPITYPTREHPPVPADQPPNDPPDRADHPQPAPASSPPCATDCTEPTLTRTPTHWSPDAP
jgi:hypothetical protein